MALAMVWPKGEVLRYGVTGSGSFSLAKGNDNGAELRLTIEYGLEVQPTSSDVPTPVDVHFISRELTFRALSADGQVLVDTETGDGIANPEQLRGELALEGQAHGMVDARGRFEVGGGDHKAVEVLKDALHGAGLLTLTLPERPIRVGEAWSAPCEVEEIGEIELRTDPPLPCKMRYMVRKRRQHAGEEVLAISVESGHNESNGRSIGLKMRQGGAHLDAALDAFERRTVGEILYSTARSRVVRATVKTTLSATFSATVGGESGSMTAKVRLAFDVVEEGQP